MLRNLSLFVGLTLALRADVNIRYKNDFKFASFLPPAINQQALGTLNSAMPPSAVMRIKGNKGYSTAGKLISIIDVSKQEITLVDAVNKKFATLPIKDFSNQLEGAMPPTPADGGPMKSLKSNVSTRKTGRTEVIQGLRADESEIIMSMDLPDAVGPLPAGPFIKMVMHVWNVQPEEVLRVPELREWVGYNAYANYVMDPLALMQRIFARMPGMGQGLTSLIEQRSKAPMLKSHVEVYLPVMALLLQKAGQQGSGAPQFDANAPFIESNSEMVELSTAPVDDSVFQVPAGFQSAPAAELLKSLTGQPAAPSTATAPPAPAGDYTPKRIIVDGNVQAANRIHKEEPLYPPVAQQARVQGTVRLKIIIDKEGHVVTVELVSGHPLLVAAAQEAVRQWTYKPTLLNGEPTEVQTRADVIFSLP